VNTTYTDTNHFTSSNVPGGLSMSIVYSSSKTAVVTLTGTAAAHADANDIANLGVTLNAGMFTSGNTPNNNTQNAWTVDFDPPYLEYSKLNFVESSADDGSIDNSDPVIITLYNDTFTGSDGDDFVGANKLSVSNTPAGLTVVATRTSATTISVTITGNATAHENINDVLALGFTFQDAAFTGGTAADVKYYTVPSLSIDFSGEVTEGTSSDGATASPTNVGATQVQTGGQKSAPPAVLDSHINVSTSFSNSNLKTVSWSGGGWSTDTWFEIYYKGGLVAVTEAGVKEIVIDISAYTQSRAVDGFTICAVNNVGSSCNASPMFTPWGIIYLISSFMLISFFRIRRAS